MQERPAEDGLPVWRGGGKDKRLALVITPQGLKAIGVEETETPTKVDQTAPKKAKAPKTKSGGKIDAVLTLMKRSQGASLTDLEKETGWQPHSIRAVISGLRKQGASIERSRNDGGVSV